MKFISKMFWFLLIVIIVPTLHSQEGSPLPRKGLERIEQLKKVRLMEEISAPEETWVKFFNRYDQYRKEQESIHTKREMLAGDLAGFLEEERSEKEFEATIKEILLSEAQLSSAKQTFYRDLRLIFTTKQIAQYMAFEMKFYKTLRENLRNRMENRQNTRRQK